MAKAHQEAIPLLMSHGRSNPSEGIPVAPQLVEKEVYVNMEALEEEAHHTAP